MAQLGAPYRAVGGSIVLPYGDNGVVFLVKKGNCRRQPIRSSIDVSGPSDGGDTVFSQGNYAYSGTLVGQLTEGTANLTSVSYTAATRTLSKTGGFKHVAVGQYLYISGGTGATAGWYQIATNADDDTVTLVTSPGLSNQTNYVVNGVNTTDTPHTGPCTLPLGNGERWSGTVLVSGPDVSVDWENHRSVPTVLSVLFTGPVTITTGLA